MQVAVNVVGNSGPLAGDVERVSVAGAVGVVLVHPIVIVAEKVGVVDIVGARGLAHPVKHCVKRSLAHSW